MFCDCGDKCNFCVDECSFDSCMGCDLEYCECCASAWCAIYGEYWMYGDNNICVICYKVCCITKMKCSECNYSLGRWIKKLFYDEYYKGFKCHNCFNVFCIKCEERHVNAGYCNECWEYKFDL